MPCVWHAVRYRELQSIRGVELFSPAAIYLRHAARVIADVEVIFRMNTEARDGDVHCFVYVASGGLWCSHVLSQNYIHNPLVGARGSISNPETSK